MSNIQQYISNSIIKYLKDDEVTRYCMFDCGLWVFDAKCTPLQLPDVVQTWIEFILTRKRDDTQFDYLDDNFDNSTYCYMIYNILTQKVPDHPYFNEEQLALIQLLNKDDEHEQGVLVKIYETIQRDGTLTKYLHSLHQSNLLCDRPFGDVVIIEDKSNAIYKYKDLCNQ